MLHLQVLGLLLGSLFFFSCKPTDTSAEQGLVEVLASFEDLQALLEAKPDQLQVINFWATSCPPCIKEMPHFNTLQLASSDLDVDILLVSLDRARDLENRVKPFVERHNILSKVVILDDQNYSAWTGKIDDNWYGALPATLIIKGDKRFFKFGAYEVYEDLLQDIRRVD